MGERKDGDLVSAVSSELWEEKIFLEKVFGSFLNFVNEF